MILPVTDRMKKRNGPLAVEEHHITRTGLVSYRTET